MSDRRRNWLLLLAGASVALASLLSWGCVSLHLGPDATETIAPVTTEAGK